MKRFFFFLSVLVFVCTAKGDGNLSPLAVYLTWTKSPDSSMTISWLTEDKDKNNSLYYRIKGGLAWQEVKGKHYKFPDVTPNYLLHRVEVDSLIPDKDYEFRIGKEEKNYFFRTLPSTLTREISFAIGGDLYHATKQSLAKMNCLCAQKDPDFVLLGGDIAYAMDKGGFWGSILPESVSSFFSSAKKRHRWIDWVIQWSSDMIGKDGRLIPIIAAVGNHDVKGGYGQTWREAPQYCLLFPLPGKEGYQALDFGNYLSIIVLDTGHMHPIRGEQTAWLQGALAERKLKPFKMAIYHIPAYPSFRSFDNPSSQAIRKYWSPLFEEAHLTCAFEHHDHAYKRSHLLKGGKIAGDGVLYLGDGAWGVSSARIPATPEERPYLAVSKAKRHFFLAKLKKQNCTITAIDEEGNVFDEVERGRSF